MNALYLIGAPGSGKSTLLTAALDGVHRAPQAMPLAHDRLSPTPKRPPLGAEIGARRTGFGGTDALAMNAITKAEEWVRTRPYPSLVAEGDRLACDRFFGALTDVGYHLTVVLLWVPPSVAAARRADRAARLNVPVQNEVWVRGRSSKAEALAARWGSLMLDGRRPLPELVAALRALPALRPFFEEKP